MDKLIAMLLYFCKPCPAGSVYDKMNTCKCNELKGFAGPDPNSCMNCTNVNKIPYQGSCKSCEIGEIIVGYQCECDQQSGYAGNANQCMDCFGQNKIIENNQCKACEIGAKFDIDKCVCDESMGYTGLNANQCDNCWGSRQYFLG
ncbi:Growth_factor receptor cysteine-rich domain superfamily [Hexamita inflata]|uniref:Growth factor receptor cysteine-rich domain superfamily n=1 Tax=Hexamita inflata TaxID=28002 RepID=A0AA86QBL6_9EUKA|nr:Growth factor receptor cysteine-rich domain superfamily [Hexamita inflata]